MKVLDHKRRRLQAGEELDGFEGRSDGLRIVDSLSAGLAVLRDNLFRRVHEDVEAIVGMDSMLIPTSEFKTEQATKLEIELYLIAVSAMWAHERGYIKSELDAYQGWLMRLRLGDVFSSRTADQRIAKYREATPSERRLQFTNVLAQVCPESRRVPLVLFRLFPLSAQSVTSITFGDSLGAGEIRNDQVRIHPLIQDCRECHGMPLDNGEHCVQCGNPVWKFKWLNSA